MRNLKFRMQYKITHTTSYRYSSPVSICHNVVMLTPQPTEYLQVQSHRLNIVPSPGETTDRVDMFGNTATRFALEQSHSQLSITATSRVTVLPRQLPIAETSQNCDQVQAAVNERTDPNWLSVAPFLYDSPRILRTAEFAEYAAALIEPQRPILAAVNSLNHQIYTDFKYDKNATKVDTPTKTAFDGRHGVCQDFAHVGVACLRSLNLPARYVSGYLRTHPPEGKPRLVGADQSHAWFSVYCGGELGWVDFDPTNDCLCGTDHIPIAVGRDYSDVVPIKGVFLGGGNPVLSVSVDVAPIE